MRTGSLDNCTNFAKVSFLRGLISSLLVITHNQRGISSEDQDTPPIKESQEPNPTPPRPTQPPRFPAPHAHRHQHPL